jgi:hypothetical protein
MIITVIDTFVSEGFAYHAISVLGKKVVIQAYLEDSNPGNYMLAETLMSSEMAAIEAMKAIRENDESHAVQKMFRLAKEAHNSVINKAQDVASHNAS